MMPQPALSLLWPEAAYRMYEQRVAKSARKLSNTPPELKGRIQQARLVQTTLAQVPWYHHIALMEKLKNPDQRLWYAQQTIEHGWSRNVLVHQIESHAIERQGKALMNFDRNLPLPQSDPAQQLLKDPYDFDFLSVALHTMNLAAHGSDLDSETSKCASDTASIENCDTQRGARE